MLDHWREWKAKCALDLCGEAARAHLRAFAKLRFDRCVRRYRGRTGLGRGDSVGMDGGGAWHLLETHLVVRENRRGKRYKDWLFARANLGDGNRLAALESGASLLMRDVVREHLRREYARRGTVSLDRLVTAQGDRTLTLHDLLPGAATPADEAARREYEALAQQHAEELVANAPRRERLALLAKCVGLSLAAPAATKAAECGHSALNEAYHAFLRRLARTIQDRYSGEERAALRLLSVLTLERAEISVTSWAAAETCCSEILMYREGR